MSSAGRDNSDGLVLLVERHFAGRRRLLPPSSVSASLVARALRRAHAVFPAAVYGVQTLARSVGMLVGGPVELAGGFADRACDEVLRAVRAKSGDARWDPHANVQIIRASEVSIDELAVLLAAPVRQGLTARVDSWRGFSTLAASLAPLASPGCPRQFEAVDSPPISPLPGYSTQPARQYAALLRDRIREMERV